MFWFYFTVAVSLVTFFFVFLSSLRNSQDPKTWFLGLPSHLRQHYAEGRTVKVQTCPNHKPIEVFTLEKGSDSSESVLIVHGLGLSSYDFRGVMAKLESKGVRVVAVDLPGSGFSEKYTIEVDEVANGIFGKLRNIYSLIREKGVFWAFDQMVDTGEIPYEEIEKLVMSRRSVKVLQLGTEEVGRVLGQVIDSLQLSPVHLVLHDSALAMSATWVVENSGSLSSVTLVDTDMNTVPAFPLWALKLPVVRELVLGLPGLYGKLMNTCCSRKINGLNMEAQRIFLKRGDGWEAVVGMGNKLNRSFDLVQWGHLKELKNVPLQVIWSGSWSEDWRNQGRQVAFGLPHARFVKHSGGRWPQSKGADEIAEGIASFISVFAKTTRQVEPEPIQKIADEAKDQIHGHHHHHDGHPHDDTPAYVEAYGLGHGWAS
uniref:AB hydrolase-1 domain-containing protein n=1 Tax=Kalanchoe fedtschenkoi TaxID=63787 RepID=A0A7N0R803_KALFE